MRFGFSALSVLALLGAPAAAQTLTVEGVVSPAWVERGGARVPLAVGMQLNDRDRIVIGSGSRALLCLASWERCPAYNRRTTLRRSCPPSFSPASTNGSSKRSRLRISRR